MASIVFAADEHYLPYLPCNLAQVARFGRSAESVALAVPPRIDPNLLAQVQRAASSYDVDLDVVRVRDIDRLYANGTIGDSHHITHFTYSKLELPEILPDLDDVLYLDVDTLIRAPLDDILAWDLHHPVGAVAEFMVSGAHLFGTPRAPYFNAGILRLSLDRLRQERLWDQAQLVLQTRDDLPWLDQDVWNVLFHNRFDSLPLTFNVSDNVAARCGLDVFEDPVIVHFSGTLKAWHHAANSPFAREWRRQYEHLVLAPRGWRPTAAAESPPATRSKRLATYTRARARGRSRSESVARAVLPDTVKQAAKHTASRGVDGALRRLEAISSVFHPSDSPIAATPIRGAQSNEPLSRIRAEVETKVEGDGLDLLISVARSGTNALGEAIGRSRPEVHWMNELFLGTRWANLEPGELVDRFPWLTNDGLGAVSAMRSDERQRAFESFAGTMSASALEITDAVLQNRRGRTLIKVFPEHLHLSAFEALLRKFRPRLLVLRRELAFTYISRLRAERAGSWEYSDLTDVPFTINDRAAAWYVLQCDAWFDRVDRLATDLGLHTTWVTHEGLFTTGTDVPLLERFYPGPAMPVDADSGALVSTMIKQDRRSDTSVHQVVTAINALSATTRARLLRQPGSRGA